MLPNWLLKQLHQFLVVTERGAVCLALGGEVESYLMGVLFCASLIKLGWVGGDLFLCVQAKGPRFPAHSCPRFLFFPVGSLIIFLLIFLFV